MDKEQRKKLVEEHFYQTSESDYQTFLISNDPILLHLDFRFNEVWDLVSDGLAIPILDWQDIVVCFMPRQTGVFYN